MILNRRPGLLARAAARALVLRPSTQIVANIKHATLEHPIPDGGGKSAEEHSKMGQDSGGIPRAINSSCSSIDILCPFLALAHPRTALNLRPTKRAAQISVGSLGTLVLLSR